MKSAVPGATSDEIEVVDEKKDYGRIRIRELQSGYNATKTSIFLTPDQLDEHAAECLRLSTTIRRRNEKPRCGVEGCRLPPDHEGLHKFGGNIP
jgi:hypothetical protein